jgi:hypothetical protein
VIRNEALNFQVSATEGKVPLFQPVLVQSHFLYSISIRKIHINRIEIVASLLALIDYRFHCYFIDGLSLVRRKNWRARGLTVLQVSKNRLKINVLKG